MLYHLQAFAYVECSARTQENLKYLFDQALRAGLGLPSVPLMQEIVLRDEDQEGDVAVGQAEVVGQHEGCCILQ